jgi:hypothetical protein
MSIAAAKRRFTADEYQRMGETGILCPDDRVELIDGEVVVKTPIGPRHNACVSSATRVFVRAAERFGASNSIGPANRSLQACSLPASSQ